ncbi:hypothetical protein CEXT_289311 [Caerostris extrusa]|uniref:Uncharacterized protein n=1 Tax=Caerostris extrusa TaxID=172846 RepID=A0AAV4RL35_CAEEX|nr:hypothetical protein CEXT_289311 [Caerostris extrusa]
MGLRRVSRSSLSPNCIRANHSFDASPVFRDRAGVRNVLGRGRFALQMNPRPRIANESPDTAGDLELLNPSGVGKIPFNAGSRKVRERGAAIFGQFQEFKIILLENSNDYWQCSNKPRVPDVSEREGGGGGRFALQMNPANVPGRAGRPEAPKSVRCWENPV